MTWILPKQLHTLASALDTAALISDSEEQSRIYAQSLFLRSKVSPARTWSAKWRRDSWTAHLSGRILRPSLGERFQTEWTSSLEVTPANHSLPPGNASAQTILATSGHSSQMEFVFFDPDSASLKMSKGTSVSDSERSLENWNQWVTRCRGEYSARVNAAHLTNGSGCSSLQWPTTAARDYKGTSAGYLFRADGKSRVDQLAVAVDQAEIGNWPTPTVQEAGKIGNQANHGQIALSNHPSLRGEVNREKFKKGHSGQAVPVNPSTDGSRLESWLTPRANEPTEDSNFVARNADRGEHCHSSLTTQAKAWETPKLDQQVKMEATWPTPEAYVVRGPIPTEFVDGKFVSLHGETRYGAKIADAVRVMEEKVKGGNWATPRSADAGDWMMNQERLAAGKPEDTLTGQATQSNKSNGKLNPRWVETLMGLPIGWTMPSCQSPVTIAQTSCASSATESSQPQQP